MIKMVNEQQTTLTDDELTDVCNKVIDFISGMGLNLATKYLVVKTLYESFLDTCKDEGYVIKEIEKKSGIE